MSETNVAQVLTGDPLEVSFPRHYTQKNFLHDASRLRDLARLQARQKLSEAELAEVVELRKRIRRADADAALLLVIETRLKSGVVFF
jgi:hypothetical protein